MQDKEIELKFVINDDIKNKVVAYLNIHGEKLDTLHFIDTYYVPYYKSFEVAGKTQECVRIRQTDNKNILTYKYIHRDATPKYCDEYETTFESVDQLEKILFAIGFSTEVIIDKIRESYKYKNFEVDFDSVVNLGEFMEVELKEDGDINEIYEFVKQFGLTKDDVSYAGMVSLMKNTLKKTNN